MRILKRAFTQARGFLFAKRWRAKNLSQNLELGQWPCKNKIPDIFCIIFITKHSVRNIAIKLCVNLKLILTGFKNDNYKKKESSKESETDQKISEKMFKFNKLITYIEVFFKKINKNSFAIGEAAILTISVHGNLKYKYNLKRLSETQAQQVPFFLR